MNVPDVIRFVRVAPSLISDVLGFMQWDLEQLMSDAEEPDEDELELEPLPQHEAGRIALEMVMILRTNKGDPVAFRKQIEDVVPHIDNPQHAMDVLMSLAGMVGVLAHDEDLARFGQFILRHEANS